MMYRKMARFGMVAALLAVSLSGTARLAAQTTGGADQAVKDVAKGLADGKPVVLWQALPASYQKDVKSLISDAAGQVDPDIYDKAFVVVQKAVKLLKNKRDIILNGDLGKGAAQKMDKKLITESYDSIVTMLDTIASSDLGKIDELKKADVEKFLTGTAPKFGTQFNVMLKLAEAGKPNDPETKKFREIMANLKSIKVTVVKAGATETTLKIEIPNDTTPTKEDVFVKVEGKWIPKDMADGWADAIKQAKTQIAAVTPFVAKERKKDVLQTMAQVEQIITQLDNTKTEKEFNEAVAQLIAPFMGGGPKPSQK